jgi:hypothetical protein
MHTHFFLTLNPLNFRELGLRHYRSVAPAASDLEERAIDGRFSATGIRRSQCADEVPGSDKLSDNVAPRPTNRPKPVHFE